ncbi:MFS transporter [Sphingomonas sp. G-3-2-10]|jgi:MFS family permease|uniref:MFS transporter n=1 Tax=Sphingomonas sp. G-3-2-10 TaxID=2728838 RepID=UPI00146CD668|nr:MFS transporter [Sphingomonas sp. G-3-2-10]NML08274.1 MFS transporter [Sphingomonas sp. G-3-2-10]
MSEAVAGAPPAAAAESAKAGAAPWGILALLTVGVLIAYFDRTSISSALADKPFVEHFGMTNADRGFVAGAFFWSYMAMQMPMGWLVDRYGVKYTYAVCFALWCLATAATGLMTAVMGLFIMRLIVGLTEAIVTPASYRWIRLNMPETHAGTAVGIFAMGNKIGIAIGAPIAAWLIVTFDWRLMFILSGLAGLIWLVPWMLLVKSDYLKKGEIAAQRRKTGAVTFGSIISSPVIWGAMIVNFCYGYFSFYCMTWMPAYLVDAQGLSLQQSGLYTFFSFAGIAIVAIVAGWAADRIIARGYDPIVTRKVFIVAGFFGASTVLLGAYAHSLEWALFWNVFSLSCLGLATANNLALCKITLIPPPAIGLSVGVQQVAGTASGGVAATLSGWLLHTTGSYDAPMMVIVVFLMIGAAACVVLLRPKWSPKVTQIAD